MSVVVFPPGIAAGDAHSDLNIWQLNGLAWITVEPSGLYCGGAQQRVTESAFVCSELALDQAKPRACGATAEWTDLLLPRDPVLIDPAALMTAMSGRGNQPLFGSRCRRDPDADRDGHSRTGEFTDPPCTLQRCPDHAADTLGSTLKARAASLIEGCRPSISNLHTVLQQLASHSTPKLTSEPRRAGRATRQVALAALSMSLALGPGMLVSSEKQVPD